MSLAEISVPGTKIYFPSAQELFAARDVDLIAQQSSRRRDGEHANVSIYFKFTGRRSAGRSFEGVRSGPENWSSIGMNDLCRYAAHPLAFMFRYVRLRPRFPCAHLDRGSGSGRLFGQHAIRREIPGRYACREPGSAMACGWRFCCWFP